MNGIRQVVTSDELGNLPIRVPSELRQRPVEVIILPIEVSDDIMPVLLTGSNAVSNAWKVIRKAQLDGALQKSIGALQEEASQNGLTPELLEELLRLDD